MTKAVDPSVRVRLSQLAAFGPRFRDPRASFGQWRDGQAVEAAENCITMPWFESSNLAREFSDVLDRAGWLLQGFDWNQWARTEEGRVLLSDPVAIGNADAAQLAKLLTALMRGERFCEGALAMAFSDGLLRAAAERAETLLRKP